MLRKIGNLAPMCGIEKNTTKVHDDGETQVVKRQDRYESILSVIIHT